MTGCGLNLKLQSVPEVRKLAKTTQEYRADIQALKVKLERAQRLNGSLRILAKKNSIESLENLLISPVAKQLLEFELKNFKKKPRGRRWSFKDKCFCLTIYKKSPSVYGLLHSLLTLPDASTLRFTLRGLHLEPGFHKKVFKELERRISSWSKKQKTVVIMFDEIALKKGLFYNKFLGCIDGFEDYAHLGRTSGIASHALVFMVRGVHKNFKIPIGYFFAKGTTPSEVLAELLVDGIKMLQSIGFNVVASISDQGATNRGAINLLRDKCEEGEYESLYIVDEAKIVHLFDTPHLIKNIRNNMMTADVRFGKDGQFIAKWDDIIKYSEYDLLEFGKKCGLTHDHLYPNGKVKMRVKLATQVFSYSVAAAICSIVVASEGKKLADCLSTAKFLYEVDLLFDVCNGPGRKDKTKDQRCHVTDDSLHHRLWKEMYWRLKNWKFVRKVEQDNDTVTEKVYVPPCVTGWMDNIKGFRRLWKTLKGLGFNYMNLRYFNSDPVENFFSIIRQNNGSNRYPTCRQFQAAYKCCMINNAFHHFKSYSKNCMDDDAQFIPDLLNPNSQSLPSKLYEPPEKCMLVRGKSDYVKAMDKTFLKCTRQGPSIQCNKITENMLKIKDFASCRLCKNALIQGESDMSSDHIFSCNMNNGLDCLGTDNFNYAALVKETRRNQQSAGIYASPAFMACYLKCLIRFLNACQERVYQVDCLEWATNFINSCDTFDWLCPKHCSSFQPILVKSMAECFFQFVCKLITKHLRDALKRQNLISKMKTVKLMNANKKKNSNWIDITDEEALAFEQYLSPDDPDTQTGNYLRAHFNIIVLFFVGRFCWIHFSLVLGQRLAWIIPSLFYC